MYEFLKAIVLHFPRYIYKFWEVPEHVDLA
jgi:hypothetical protein